MMLALTLYIDADARAALTADFGDGDEPTLRDEDLAHDVRQVAWEAAMCGT